MENELNKMTAVQWFIEQLKQKGDASENVSIKRVQISINTSDYLELIRQTKQMEKEQIIDACKKGYGSTAIYRNKLSEQYYEETYGGNK